MSARIALLALLLAADASVAANLPNIVLIVSDNQSQTLLGAYRGHRIQNARAHGYQYAAVCSLVTIRFSKVQLRLSAFGNNEQ